MWLDKKNPYKEQNLGDVVATRVIYAHEAVKKLHALLDDTTFSR
jgi:hypothetical protein